FEAAMEAQRQRARSASNFKMDANLRLEVEGATEFAGYQQLAKPAVVVALLKGNEPATALSEGDEGALVLDATPFYAESGGQAGDCGVILGEGLRFEVRDTQKAGAHFIHLGVVASGGVSVGQGVNAEVDADIRQATALNHSATHLLHAALRRVLGEHVNQKGSLVTAERLRFDFAHPEAVKVDQLAEIEALVNTEIRRNTAVETLETDIESAKQRGAMMLFGEKYGDTVRVLSMGGDFSVELCGGTHVSRTGDIGLIRIVSESGVAAGVRRIEAVTGAAALAEANADRARLQAACAALKTGSDNFDSKLAQLLASHREQQKELERLKAKLATAGSRDLAAEAEEINGIRLLAVKIDGADPKTLRDSVDQLKNKLGSAVVLLATADGDKVALVAGVTKDLVGRVKAGDVMKVAAAAVGGKGGGRPDMAQGGGTDVNAIPEALKAVKDYVNHL
ncbi:MAG: DHHA1 domain-containing protein, partial [Spongiibacter sp.]